MKTPHRIDGIDQKVECITAGIRGSFFVTEDEVFACGSNRNLELGFDKIIQKIDIPTKIPCIGNVKKVCTGFKHCIFFTKNYDIYGCGSNKLG